MSVESEIKKLTAAVVANTEALVNLGINPHPSGELELNPGPVTPAVEIPQPLTLVQPPQQLAQAQAAAQPTIVPPQVQQIQITDEDINALLMTESQRIGANGVAAILQVMIPLGGDKVPLIPQENRLTLVNAIKAIPAGA